MLKRFKAAFRVSFGLTKTHTSGVSTSEVLFCILVILLIFVYPDSMNFKSDLNQQIADYLIQNPIKEFKEGYYDPIATKFNVTKEQVRNIYRRLRKQGQISHPNNNQQEKEFKVSENGHATLRMASKKEITSLEELVDHCKIDLKVWKVIKWGCGAWNSITKDAAKQAHIHTMYRVYADLAPRIIIQDLEKQKDALLNELRESSLVEPAECLQAYYKLRSGKERAVRDLLFEPAVFDLHIGKMAWREETGEDYDSTEAVKRFVTANEVLLGRVDLSRIERILVPVGNDMVHIDNRQGLTTNGTPQDTDSRYFKMIRTTKNMIISTVEKFLLIAPVDIVIVSGNHDFSTMFNIGEILDAYFHHNRYVNVINPATSRKFYQYGLNSFMLTHGDEEKIADLPQIFAASNPKLWADTKYRQIQIGHFHKKKTIANVTIDSFPGVEVKILSSLSGTDAWHYRKGYMAPKRAEALMFHAQEGQVGEFFYNL